MPDRIPYGRQWVDDEDIEAVSEVLRSDFLTTGPAVAAFEEGLRPLTGARHAAALSSGTAALHAMYHAVGVGPGTEIVTTPMTFAATANAALYLGAGVRFADVDAGTGLLDPELVEAQVTDRTRAIVAVDYTGQPADYDALRPIAERHGLALLADAAHSLGAADRGRPAGSLADASMLSFHPVKPVTTAEGGAVVTDDAEIDARVRRFRTHGMKYAGDDLDRPDEGPWFHEQHELGFNYRLTDLQAALGHSQLRRLGEFIARRRTIAARYDAAFAGLEALSTPVVRAGAEPGWHLYVVLVRDAARRRAFFERLQALGLGVQVHYIPTHLHPYYRRLGHDPGDCPVAEDRYDRSVTLPLFPRMTDAEVNAVIERVRSAVTDVL